MSRWALLILKIAIAHSQPNDTSNSSQKLDENIYCSSLEYCIGESCDFTCKYSSDVQLEDSLLNAVDVENSDDCIFFFPIQCETCKCIARASHVESQNVLKLCQPCQFRRIAWLRADERKKCAPEISPHFFPTSCGMRLLTAEKLVAIMETSLRDGLWIHMMGDSILRGVFLHAISFLSIRSKHIQNIFNWTANDPYGGHYVCCSARYPNIDECEHHVIKEVHLPIAQHVTEDIIERRSRGVNSVCVSFVFNGFWPVGGFAELKATFEATGIRPTSIIFNPGAWILDANFDLHKNAEQLKSVQTECATLFAEANRTNQLTCILMTMTNTGYKEEDVIFHNHRRITRYILAYNKAMETAWLDGKMPLIDAGALSLHPAIANSIDNDKLHFGIVGRLPSVAKDSSPTNPFSSLVWQLMLHTNINNGSHPCEHSLQATLSGSDLAAISKHSAHVRVRGRKPNLAELIARLSARKKDELGA